MSGLESLLTGRVLVKRYRIGEVIGRGGFAAVYRADDERLGRPVAVKVITVAAADDDARRQIRERFDREARAAAALPHHPNVVTVHDFGTDPELGLDFLVMELLVGEDLATHLARHGRPPPELGMRILRDAAEGIAVGHRAGLIHRDIKPGNVFLAEPHGGEPFRVCVLDFGIARIISQDDASTRLTAEQNPLSPAYASPEQLRGERELTPASDVYSLGLVGHQLLSGDKPVAGADPRPLREANPDVPEALAAVIDRATSPDPSARPADAVAFAAALDDAAGGDRDDDRTMMAPVAAAGMAGATPRPAPPPVVDDGDRTILQPAAPPPPPQQRPRVDRRQPAPRRSGTPAAFLAVLLLVLAGGAWWLFAQDARRGERDVAPAAVDTVADDPERVEAAPSPAPVEREPAAPAEPVPAEPSPATPPTGEPTPAPPAEPPPPAAAPPPGEGQQPPPPAQPQQPQPQPQPPRPAPPPPAEPQRPPVPLPVPIPPVPREPPPPPPRVDPTIPHPPDTIRIP